MSKERLVSETPSIFRASIEKLKSRCPNLIVAVDQELGGIQRLQGLVPPLPELVDANLLNDDELAEQCFQTARVARELGVSMFLAPIADIVDGQNSWLENRTMGPDAKTVA